MRILTVLSYIQRHQDELEQFEKERRPGRPRSNREDLLRQKVDAEGKEYDSGFWIPNVMDADTAKDLKDWSGDWASLATLKFVRIAHDGGMRDSSFPPKGQS